MSKLADWFDDRTGYRHLVREMLYERIPGGARWRYVWGSTLVFLFAIQVVTGLFLWMAYSPSAQTAWESVYHIQHEMQAGWLLRGIHHYSAQAMIVMLALHVLQVVWFGAYRPPREINWLIGIVLLQITLALSLTGYLLPWDQKGYWATQVATKIAGVTPVIGPAIQELIVGGPSYGHHTLTRFFALHAGLLPALLTVLIVAHVAIFRRHGVTAPRNAVGEEMFWPQQALKDVLACFAVMSVVVFFVLRNGGADLGAPADPSEQYSAARPEWYFLFLFQFLKYFPGETEIIGAILIPGAVLTVLALFPWIGKHFVGHALCIVLVTGLLGGIAYLTNEAMREDHSEDAYQRAVTDAEQRAQRVVELAKGLGIGERGAVALLRDDPKTQGPMTFSRNCAQCHRWNGHDGTGRVMQDPPTCSDLGDFGTRKWIKEFITHPAGEKFFGATARNPDVGDRFTNGAMAQWAKKNIPDMTTPEIDAVVEFLIAQSGRQDIDPPKAELAKEGEAIFEFGTAKDVNEWEEAEKETAAKRACINCHRMASLGDSMGLAKNAPDLTGYGSEEWLRGMILNPDHDRYYGKEHNEMPPYRNGRISAQELELLLAWMRGRWYEPRAQMPEKISPPNDPNTAQTAQ